MTETPRRHGACECNIEKVSYYRLHLFGMMLTRCVQLASKPLDIAEFVTSLSQQLPVYKEADAAFRVCSSSCL